jgi:hypothetical protein
MDISTAALQIFVDDFQAPVWCADYFVTINGYDIPKLAVTINNLVQTGPIGKIITYVFPQDQLFLLLNDSLSIMFDDTTTGAGDGYAIDFVKLMINLEGFAYTGKIYGYVTDLNTGLPIEEVKVILEDLSEVMTDQDGYYIMTDVPAGINYFMSTKFGYDTASAIVDLVAGDSLQRDFTIEEILDAEFIAVPTGGVYPLTVQFSDLSTQDPTEWHWDFGDGDTSVLQNPGHTYNSAGIYTVSLRASNELEANTETKIDYIEVGTFGLNEMGSPTTFQIYPNPFTTSTNLSYTLERSENIRFTIYNLQGQIVYTMQQSQEMGDQKLEWNAEGLPAGIYYFRIQAGDKVGGGKIIKISDI